MPLTKRGKGIAAKDPFSPLLASKHTEDSFYDVAEPQNRKREKDFNCGYLNLSPTERPYIGLEKKGGGIERLPTAALIQMQFILSAAAARAAAAAAARRSTKAPPPPPPPSNNNLQSYLPGVHRGAKRRRTCSFVGEREKGGYYSHHHPSTYGQKREGIKGAARFMSTAAALPRPKRKRRRERQVPKLLLSIRRREKKYKADVLIYWKKRADCCCW